QSKKVEILSQHALENNLISVHTQGIERLWRELKKLLKLAHGNNEMVDEYIGEFCYRQNILAHVGSDPGSQLLKFMADVRRVYPGLNASPVLNKK
ncbi:unnamed protein product, partial [Allacma fusca]